MEIKVIGTGGVLSKLPTAYIINESILIDCGLEIVKKIISNGDIEKIKTICITHLHMDHVGGLELFVFYKQFKKSSFSIFAGVDFLDFYKNLKCSINPSNGDYYQPFEFHEFFHAPAIHSQHTIDNFIQLNVLKSIHMADTIPAYTFKFIETDNSLNSAKVIISGDTEVPLKITASMLEKENTLCFHDMGWTGLDSLRDIHKAHCSEVEVFNVVGSSNRLFGIHINDGVSLDYYQKAETDKVYEI